MSDWSSTFWGSTAGLFGEEDEDDAFDPDRQVCIVFLHVPNQWPNQSISISDQLDSWVFWLLNARSMLIKA